MCATGPEIRGIRVELLTAPDCPNAEAARSVVAGCLAESGLDTTLVERVGRYRSPTILVDGVDVMGTPGPVAGDACRLDVPTRERVLAALASKRG
ncbi:alkylmercury lyase [Amycolatopsis sp. NPDC004079]|uniref:alkylmercury lyase n=1 Tax=Amycolatopsis sp. NPDC004079 TaxID=3154549 RepID=UPI0033A00C6B